MGFLDAVKKVIMGEAEGAEAPDSAPAAEDRLPPAADAATVEQALREVIAEQSDGLLTAADVPADAPLLDEGHLDSLSSVKVLMFIEKSYGVEIQESELTGRLNTLAALVKHVAATAAQGRGGDA